MVDLDQLPPAEMAAQVGRPDGEIGVAVGDYMSRVNAQLTHAAYRRLTPPPGARMLEIGFGNGKLIPSLLAMAARASYAGVDISQTMVDAALENNCGLVDEGRVALHRASVERLPFPDASFDRAVAINTIYFWPDQRAGLAEIRRVLHGDGLLVTASMTPETAAQSQTARPEYGFRVSGREELLSLHRQAGFANVACELYEEEIARLDGTAFHRVYNLVLARP
ncbi:MAG TPA: class I SAM-dependent methyltransferase [Propylenella sp.]